MGYSPWDHKDLDTTEGLHIYFHLPIPRPIEYESWGGGHRITVNYKMSSKVQPGLRTTDLLKWCREVCVLSSGEHQNLETCKRFSQVAQW